MATRRFVALGDSFTEGLHDEIGPDGRYVGWADRVAGALSRAHGGLQYANLAVRGRLLDEVVAEQVPVAMDLRADVVSFHAGANDVLRPKVDIADLMVRYDAAVAALCATGADVLLFTVTGRADGRQGRLVDALARRFGAFNDGVREAARQHGATVVDVGAAPAMSDPRLWHEDRLHLAPDGHRRVAAAVLEALDAVGLVGDHDPADWWRQPLPALPPVGRVARARAELQWATRHLAPWVGRRLRGVSSGDTVTPKQTRPIELPSR